MFHIDRNFRSGIVRLTLSGLIRLDEVEEIAKIIHGDSSMKCLFLLTDTREARYDFEYYDMDQLINVANQYTRPEVTVFEAILIHAPHEMVISTIFDKRRARPAYHTKVFSTEEAAIEWLEMKNG